MSDLIKRGKECAEAWFSHGNWPDAELVLELVAEIERLRADNECLIRSDKVWLEANQQQDAEIERLKAVVDAAKDYLWCTADPPTEQMARAKLEQALAALEDGDE